MYNIEVDADHCYRVGEQSVLVHNVSAKECGLFGERFGSDPKYTREAAGNTGERRTTLMQARLTKERIQGGQDPTVYPPGFPMGVNPPLGAVRVARGHILAKDLGGKGDAENIQNLMPICQQTTNITMRDLAESKVAAVIKMGYTVDYEVAITYWTKNPLIPKSITIRAKGWKCGTDNCWELKAVKIDQILDLSDCPATRS